MQQFREDPDRGCLDPDDLTALQAIFDNLSPQEEADSDGSNARRTARLLIRLYRAGHRDPRELETLIEQDLADRRST